MERKDLEKKYKSIKEFEKWKKVNKLREEDVFNPNNSIAVEEILNKRATLIMYAKGLEYAKTEDAKKYLTLDILSSDFAANNRLDDLICGYLVWKETQSVEKLYDALGAIHDQPWYLADNYHDVIFFIKANGEKINATNLKVNSYCECKDEGFDLNKKFEDMEKTIKEKTQPEKNDKTK